MPDPDPLAGLPGYALRRAANAMMAELPSLAARALHRIAVLTLTENRATAARRDAPSATA